VSDILNLWRTRRRHPYSGATKTESRWTVDTEDLSDAIDELEALASSDSRATRAHSLIEVQRHRDVVAQLASGGESVAEALRSVSVVDRVHDRGEARPRLDVSLPTRPLELHSRGLAIRGTPFDFQWEARRDWGGAFADRSTGQLRVQVDSASTPGDTDHTWNAAGIGIRVPTGPGVQLMRVSGFMPYDFRWHNDSSLEVARNRGDLRVLVREVGGKTRLDHTTSLWAEGTGWWDERGGDGDNVFNDSSYVFVEPDRDHEVWVWFTSSIDYSHSGQVSPAWSSASNDLDARLAIIVTEQYGS
jgi:hypothetical protein